MVEVALISFAGIRPKPASHEKLHSFRSGGHDAKVCTTIIVFLIHLPSNDDDLYVIISYLSHVKEDRLVLWGVVLSALWDI